MKYFIPGKSSVISRKLEQRGCYPCCWSHGMNGAVVLWNDVRERFELHDPRHFDVESRERISLERMITILDGMRALNPMAR